MRPLPEGLVLAWYGDDFTGSAAVMEVLSFAGLPAVLFLEMPSPERIARFDGLRAIGLAGDARARGPAWMEAELPGIFSGLRGLAAPILHYKICSTLDSAPHTGSIGRVADIALGPEGWAPLVVAAPQVGRWQAFGTLFARAGTQVHRLDRHPTMAVHPVTPMDEADVRRHLARQSARAIGLVDLRDLHGRAGAAALSRERAAGAGIVAFDVIDDATLAETGRAIWNAARAPIFAIGSQGLEYALVAAWRADGLLEPARAPSPAVPNGPVAVVSGSCSPVTAEQIDVAEAAGFAVIALDAAKAAEDSAWAAECARAADLAVARIGAGQSVIAATARGVGTAIAGAAADGARGGFDARLGTGLGRLLDAVIHRTGIKRVAIAGGDTSSHAAKALGLFALSAIADLGPGAPLLRGHSDDAARDGLEIALKGGQMGAPDFFVAMRNGAARAG